MRLPRFQFTIRRLLLLIAGCAVALALLRTPFGFVVVAFGVVLPGFLIERAKGGAGILGGALSASVIVFAGGLVIGFFAGPSTALALGDAVLQFIVFLQSLSLVAFLCGALLSTILYKVLALLYTLRASPMRDDSCGPIRWHRQNDEPVERK